MQQDFITIEQLTTFAGLITAVVLVTQFIKWIMQAVNIQIKNTTIYKVIVWGVSLILLFLFNPQYLDNPQTIVLGIINSMFLTLSSMGMYDSIDGQNDHTDISILNDTETPYKERYSPQSKEYDWAKDE